MSKFCMNCGAKMDDNALFCAECGTRIEQQETQPAEQSQQNPYAQPVQQPAQPTPPPQYAQPQQNYYQAPPQYAQPQQSYYAQPVQAVPQPAPRQKKPGKGFGIASLILGIFAAVNAGIMMLINLGAWSIDFEHETDGAYAAYGLSFAIIFFVVFVGILALLSLIFGIVSLVKGNRGTAIAGLILSVLAVAACVISIITVANLKKPNLNELVNNGSSYNSSSLESSLDDLEDFLDQFK